MNNMDHESDEEKSHYVNLQNTKLHN